MSNHEILAIIAAVAARVGLHATELGAVAGISAQTVRATLARGEIADERTRDALLAFVRLNRDARTRADIRLVP